MARNIVINFDALNSEPLVIHTPYGEVHISLVGSRKKDGAMWVQVNGSVDELHSPTANIVDVRLSDDPGPVTINTERTEKSAALKELPVITKVSGPQIESPPSKTINYPKDDLDDDPGDTGC